MSRQPFNPDNPDMLEISTKYHGNISQIANYFNVSRETIYQYQNRNPIGKKIIDEVRGYNTEFDLDIAEHVNRHNMLNYKDRPALAQRAAEKVLDKKGQSRGWKDRLEEVEKVSDEIKNQYDSLIKQLTDMKIDRQKCKKEQDAINAN